MSERIPEGVKEVALLGLIEIEINGLTNFSKIGEDLDRKEDASLAVFL